MANISTYAAKFLLDVCLSGATFVPPQHAIGLGVAPPNSTVGSELGTASGYARQNVTFIAAAAAGSASNVNAMTFGPFSSVCTISGIQLWDTTANSGTGNLLWYGTLATVRTVQQAGDFIVLAAGALVITLS